MKTLSAAALALLLAAGAVRAQQAPPPPPAPALPMALALEAAQTALTTCTANGYKVGAVVVDAAAGERLRIGVDAARTAAIDASGRKAYTAAVLISPTAAIETQVKTDAALQAKVTADTKMFARAGGLPIMMGGKMVGAIGVGGAPGGDKDEVCAKAGLAKIADRLK